MPDDPGVRRAALLSAAAASFLTPFMASAVSVALPSIAREFALDAVSLSWIPTAYMLAALVFLLPFGRLGDIHGRKRLFVVGLLVDAAGSLLMCLVSSSFPALVVFRALQGVGGAMIFGTSLAILTSVFPATERGKVLGISVSAVYAGLTLGPFLGGMLTEHLGWRSLFVLNALIALGAAGVVVSQLKGEWAEAKGEAFDWVGSAVYGPSLVALMYGFSRLPDISGAITAAVGVGGLAVFVLWESRQERPLIEVRLFRDNRVFALSSLAALISYSSAAGAVFLLSLYLQELKGLAPDRAGIVLLAAPLVQTVFSPLAGWLSDRVEPRIVASAGMALTAAALASFHVLGMGTPLPVVGLCLALFGLGFALFSSPNTNAIMGSVDRRIYGVASGIVGTMRLTGQMLSMGVVMLVLSAYVGRAQITPATHGPFLQSAKLAFTLFALLCTGGIFASLARGRVRQGRGS